MGAASEVALSRVATVASPTRLWQGVSDEAARIVDLHDVSFNRGRLVLHGVDPAEAPALRQTLVPYRHFVENVITQDRFEDVFELSPEPLRWAECVQIEERCTLFLSPWHIDNAFHLHCDNLLPIFANLCLGGLLDAPRLLYLYDGDPFRNARAIRLWDLVAALFDGAVKPVAALRVAQGRIGFRRVRWGRGPALPYLRGVRATPYEGAVEAYREWAFRGLGITDHVAPRAGAKPRLLYLDRSDSRRIVNPELLAEAFAELGYELRVFSEWSTTGNGDLVALAHGADVLLGPIGAALVHQIYMPRGSVMVELMTGSFYEGIVWIHLARLCGHRHVRIDVPGSRKGQPCVVSRPAATAIARRILAEWQQRHTPIPAWRTWIKLARCHVWSLRRHARIFRFKRST